MGKNEKSVVSCYNMETGEKIHEFDATPLDVSPNLCADTELTYHIRGNLSFTLDDCESREMWGKFITGNPQNTTVEFDGHIPIVVQARKHKKCRINKKWLKKYGMKVAYQKAHGKMIECSADTFPNHVEISSTKIKLIYL